MRLLIYTQKIDKSDTVLGFFHDWVIRMSKVFNEVLVVCLELGDADLPPNVKVYSLGKEKGFSKIKYIFYFYKYLNILSGKYDSVFVHMNQEYVLLGGLYWKIKNIPVYLWRNHKVGGLLTRVSVFLSNKVFYTSTKSFTSKFNNAIQMPVGVNEELFKENSAIIRKKYSICMVGRISFVKHIDIALEAINILIKEGVQVSLSVIGDTGKTDNEYFDILKKYVVENGLEKIVSFRNGVSQSSLPEIYGSYEICINVTEEGSFDKTIVEAAMCGVIPLVSSSSFSGILPDICITNTDPIEMSRKIKNLLEPESQIRIKKDLESFVNSHSLKKLIDRLNEEIK